MKKTFVCILALFVSACNATSTSGPAVESSTAATPSSAVDPIRFPSPTPTIFSTATSTPVPPTLAATAEEQIGQTQAPVFAQPLIIPTLQAGKLVKLSSIQMIDAQIGWGIQLESSQILRPDYQGNYFTPSQPEGYILRTSDGGKTWQNATPPTGAYSPGGLFALAANTAWASSNIPCCTYVTATTILRTTDGGRTWQTSQPFPISIPGAEFYLPVRMQFVDQNTGWLLASVDEGMNSRRHLLFRTTDGGDTWTEVNSFLNDLGGCWSAGFAFINSTTGWYGSNCFSQGVIYEHLETFYAAGKGKIRTSVDGGETFRYEALLTIPVELKQPELAGLNSECAETKILPISNDVAGVEWGCHIFDNGMDFRYFALTPDGGLTWNSWVSSGNEYFLDAKHGWRLLATGQLQQTTYGGLTWTTIKTVTWEKAQFEFIDPLEGWAIVSSGEETTLVHTVDGGQSWTEIKPVIAP